jgi:hypothetical protein
MTVSMQHLVQEYLDERRGLGFALTMAFARFADAAGHRGPLTRELITNWARDRAKRATPLTWSRRIEVLRPFAKHRARVEPGTYVPDADTFGRGRRRLAPHIYTDREITDLLAAAGRLSPKGTLRPMTYRALFGLIAANGLRLSEALRLQCADVDLDAGVLTGAPDQVRQVAARALAPDDGTSLEAVPDPAAAPPADGTGRAVPGLQGHRARQAHGPLGLRSAAQAAGLDRPRWACRAAHPRSAPHLRLPPRAAVTRARHRYR